ncbi:MFS transporter [Lipingzhangella sp. LS1_29]|uniref:MFS transporter n=1 Tax=Lipingzhangella rawalii TaxID=2055835 RepID=A0ABU2H7Q9_9ACTN|nr:MFS transporter [Lipingzhangella rawalii]MDS1271346.1 MFS transporter [Lipingzhangella rawalii]
MSAPGLRDRDRELRRSTQAWYGTGAVATSLFNTVPGLLLLYYLTDALAVAPALAGLVVVVPKLVDLVASPYVGMLSDRTRSRWGPRHPWMLVGAVTLPLLFVLVFAGLPLRGPAAAAYVLAAFVLAAVAAAMFQVPYVALPGEITASYHRRSVLQSWRTAFVGVAILLGGALAPLLVDRAEDELTGYRTMAMVMATVMLVAMLGTVRGTRRVRAVIPTHNQQGVWAQVGAAARHPHFRWLLVTNVLMMTAAGAMVAGVPYVTAHVLGDGAYTSLLVVCVTLPLVATMPLWTRLSARLDKRGAAVLAAVIFSAGAFGLALIPQLGGLPWAIAMSMVVGVGYAGCTMLPYSMLGDCVAVSRAVGGHHQAGMLTGVWTSTETLAQAVGAQLLAGTLAVSGYAASEAGQEVTQSATALHGMLLGSTVLPAVVMLLCLVPLRRYQLDRATTARLSA